MPGHAIIQVVFIDASTDRPLGEAKLPVENLPESFEAATTLQLGGRSFEVVSATPMNAREFQATGTLRLVLREVQVQTVDPRTLLYSLPTLVGALPAIAEGSTKQGRRVLELHEDDWRQTEFVAHALQASIEEELEAIARIHTEHRKGAGFDALHLRQRIPSPLEDVRLTLAELRATLGEAAAWAEGLSFRGVAGLIEGGFSVQPSSAFALYGTERGGDITALGLSRTGASADVEGDARMLSALATRYQLCLVDWCAAARVPSSLQGVQAWLAGRD